MASTRTEDASTITEMTLQKLASSLMQYTASSLTSVAIPEFRGLPNEDIHEFISKFKIATITFSEELRCLALQKALSGAARTWAKSNLKHASADGDWKRIKTKLVERFGSPNSDLRHREKLANMRFNPELGTLTSYVEEFVECYRKAHNKPDQSEVIKALSLNLPKNIIRNLNVLSEDWVEYEDLDRLYSLVKRLENKILPYEQDADKTENKVDIKALTKVLGELKNSLKEQQEKLQEAKAENQALAAAKYEPKEQSGRRSPEDGGPYRRRYSNRVDQRQRQYAKPGPRRYPYARQDQKDSGHARAAATQQQNGPDSLSKLDNNRLEEVQKRYEETHGKPPNGCFYCGGPHWNRHCMYYSLNV